MGHKGHYGHYTGNAKHSVNSWEEEDVKKGKDAEKAGHYGHAKLYLMMLMEVIIMMDIILQELNVKELLSGIIMQHPLQHIVNMITSQTT